MAGKYEVFLAGKNLITKTYEGMATAAEWAGILEASDAEEMNIRRELRERLSEEERFLSSVIVYVVVKKTAGFSGIFGGEKQSILSEVSKGSERRVSGDALPVLQEIFYIEAGVQKALELTFQLVMKALPGRKVRVASVDEALALISKLQESMPKTTPKNGQLPGELGSEVSHE